MSLGTWQKGYHTCNAILYIYSLYMLTPCLCFITMWPYLNMQRHFMFHRHAFATKAETYLACNINARTVTVKHEHDEI